VTVPEKEQNTKQTDDPARKSQVTQQVGQEPVLLQEDRSPLALAARWAALDPGQARPADILALQRVAGNRAVSRLIQTKLTVGPVGDRYEQEADRVAQQVVSSQQPAVSGQRGIQRQEKELQAKPLAASITPLLQRQEEEELQMNPLLQRQEEEEELQMQPLLQRQEEEEEELQMQPNLQRQEEEEEEIQMKPRADGDFQASSDLEQRLASQKGGGSPLPDETRAFMEPRFGADFGGVRVHTSGEAVQLAQDLKAQAFTHGQDVYFGAGKYAPNTDAGQRLLAHELTHTIQQTGGNNRRASAKVNRLPSGSQGDVVQRVELPSVESWKERTKLKWKRRSGKLKKIDQALGVWHKLKGGGDRAKCLALNSLWTAIQNWQATKKEGGKQSGRKVPMQRLQADVRELLADLQPGGEVATLTLNVDVESDDPMNRSFGDLRHCKVGHAWITLDYDTADANRLPNVAGFNAQNKAALRAGTPQKASLGFYPKKFRNEDDLKQLYYGTLNLSDMGSSTLMQPDDRHQAKAQKSYRVTDEAVTQVGNFAEQSKGRDYHMGGYNCTSFALGAIKAAGHTPPPGKLRGIHQPNKLYRSLHRLGKAGDTTVNDRVELARKTVADQSKNFMNLTADEAKAIMLVSMDHPQVCTELELSPIEGDVTETLQGLYLMMDDDRKERVEDPAQRLTEFRGMIEPYVGQRGRLYAMQMAALLQTEDVFSQWLDAVKLPIQTDLARATVNNQDKTYANITQQEGEAIMRVTTEAGEAHQDLGLVDSDTLVEHLYQLWDMFWPFKDQLADPGTRLATIRGWIQREGEDEGTPEGRKLNMQTVALVMDTSKFTKWLGWAEARHG
jgi:hypothetical protein